MLSLITPQEHQKNLSELSTRLDRQGLSNKDGLFGNDSKLWEVCRESIIFAGSGRAALLQLAHPWVAAAIAEHSNVPSDRLGRFHRTFRNVFKMVYGSRALAFAASEGVYRVHQSIYGNLPAPCVVHNHADTQALAHAPTDTVRTTPNTLCTGGSTGKPTDRNAKYTANESDALLWVHATLWDTTLSVFEKFVRPLSALEKEQFYQETCKFAALFGLTPDHLPKNWPAFQRYNQDMWEKLQVNITARTIAHALFVPGPLGALTSDQTQQNLGAKFSHLGFRALGPAADQFKVLTGILLPESLREGFDLKAAPSQVRRVERNCRILKTTYFLLPNTIRYVPPYHAATRRILGKTGVPPFNRVLTRLWVGMDRLVD